MCAAGYRLSENGKCIVETPSTFLLISKSKPASIKGITLNGQNETMIPITGLSRPSAIDFDVSTRSILYSDTDRHRIGRSTIEGGETTVILNKGLDKCDGISIDWLARNLYWTDEGRRSISVLKLSNSTQKRTLIQSQDIRPASIVVNPKSGIMFWAHNVWLKAGSSYIEKAWMDGTHREYLVNVSVTWPSGLALDLSKNRLYWSDTITNKIESIDFNGKDRRIAILKDIEHPYGLSFHNNILYFVELSKGTVMKYDLNKSLLLEIDSGNEPLFQTKVYDANSQIGLYIL